MTPEAVLAATGRILELHRGTGKPDSRDEIYYKRFRDLPETGKEFLREGKPGLQRRIAWQLEKQEITEADLRSTFGPGLINPTVKAIFSRTKLQGAGETTNILDMLSSDSKVTVTGEHGISSEHKVTEQARDVRARDKNPLSILNRTSDLFLLLRRHDEKHIFIPDSELKIRRRMTFTHVILCRISGLPK